MPRKHTTKDGDRSKAILKQVVSLRNKELSWAAIAEKLEVSPRTVRRMFDEVNGPDAHFESRLPGKGGRTRAVEATEQAEA